MIQRHVIGQRFGELLVLDDIALREHGRSRRFLICQCSCGQTTRTAKDKVLRGYTLSCGHLQKEMRSRLGEIHKLPYGESSFNETYECYKYNALKRHYEFNLTKEEFREIVTGSCFYCGKQNTQEKGDAQCNGKFKYTGIDRYDNNLGYIKSNCVPCCKVCNMMKGTMSAIEFKEKLETILNSKFWTKRL